MSGKKGVDYIGVVERLARRQVHAGMPEDEAYLAIKHAAGRIYVTARRVMLHCNAPQRGGKTRLQDNNSIERFLANRRKALFRVRKELIDVEPRTERDLK